MGDLTGLARLLELYCYYNPATAQTRLSMAL